MEISKSFAHIHIIIHFLFDFLESTLKMYQTIVNYQKKKNFYNQIDLGRYVKLYTVFICVMFA